jgi:integrase
LVSFFTGPASASLSSTRVGPIDSTNWHGKRGTAHYLWDDEIAGFGVRIYPSGRKSFFIAYRAKGRQRFHTVGRFGELTLHEARIEALEKLAKIRRGADPSGERQSYREAPTMEDLADRYMREHARLKKKPKTVKNDERSWRLHVLPRIGRYKVADVTRADVIGLHTEMAEIPYAANRVVALLSKAFNLAEVWGWRPDGSNPCRHVTRFKEYRRQRYLSQEELGRLADALAMVERERSESPAVVAAIRLLILTGCRVGEIRTLHWDEVDFERKALRLRDSKTGAKTVYLSNPALQVLAAQGHHRRSEYVLPGAKPGRPLYTLTRPWFRIRERAGLENVRLHDLRHSYASVGAGAGLSLPMIGKLLGHRHSATTERYAHLGAHPVRQAAELVGSRLEAVMNGGAV